MKARYKFYYNRKNKLNKRGEALVQLEVYLKGKRKYLSTNIYLKPDQWDADKLVVKHRQASYYINEMNKLKNRCEDFEMKLLYNDLPFDLDKLTGFMETGTGSDSFIGFMELEISKANHLKPETRRHHRNTLGKLKKFSKISNFSDLTFENIKAFNAYLVGLGIEINTIANQHKNIKVHINSAIKKGLYDMNKNPYIKFEVKKVKKSRPALSAGELKSIEHTEIPDNITELTYIRELFLFACYTGLRFSDVMALRQVNIVGGPEGITLKLKAKKTENIDETELSLPLYNLFDGKPQEILKQYAGKNRVFPDITNAHINRMLKVMASLAGVNRSLSFHMARHTFGTMLADKTGDPYLIKSLMGHAKIETSMQYIHESTAEINRKLGRVKW